MNKETEIAWSAGILEGEGCFLNPGKKKRIRVVCTMTDLDILLKLQEIHGGAIYSEKKRKEHWKDAWKWLVDGDAALACMTSILPYMGNRRTEKIKSLLENRGNYASERDAAKATREQVGKLHNTTNKTTRQLAEEFNMSQSSVWKASMRYRGLR